MNFEQQYLTLAQYRYLLGDVEELPPSLHLAA